jgi:hypothetical protein
MNTLKKILSVVVPLAFLFTACDPNEDLYETLDNMQKPYNEGITYTLVEADYTRFGGFIQQYLAFSDTFPAMDYVPDVLKVRFVTLREESSALVTFNHFLLHPLWWDAGFGYELTEADYNYMQTPAGHFTPQNPPQNNIPFWLLKEYPGAQTGDQKLIIYNFLSEGEIQQNLATYEFDGENWILIETIEDIPYVGYELTPEDYDNFGGSVARFGNFSASYPPETHLPVLLRNILPFALEGAEQVVKYKFHNGTQVVNNIDKYQFDGTHWIKIPYTEERTEQYIFGELGWAFDPTVTFQMSWSDYMYLATIDPIPHETFNDFGYYYGASAFFRNFDIRLIGRRLNKDPDGNYRDPELGQIYENEGSEAAMAEMLRRIAEEGIIKLLQDKFPDATPQVGGIDVHYIVRFETFADNWVRNYPETEYICTAAGNPPQFELVRGP